MYSSADSVVRLPLVKIQPNLYSDSFINPQRMRRRQLFIKGGLQNPEKTLAMALTQLT